MGHSHSLSTPALTVSGIGVALRPASRDDPRRQCSNSVDYLTSVMSQSKPFYDVESPKHSARTRRERQNSGPNTASADIQVEPACRSRAIGHSVEKRDWREIVYDERRVVSYEPCEWPECFPDGPPDATEIETVIRSSHQPTVYHRPRATATDAQSCESEHDGRTGVVYVAVSAITELHEGERVAWEGQRWSMHVDKSTSKQDGVVRLAGSNGGNYRIEERSGNPRTHAVYPGVGIITGLCRVVPADDQPRPERA